MEAPQKLRSLVGKILKYVIPLIVTVGLCWLMFKNINFSEMVEIIRNECSYGWILFALFVSIFSHVFRALRWDIQLRALNIKAPFFTLVLSIFGTYAINLIFPRLGEVWRSGFIAQRQKAPFSTVFGSMLADRLADTITVLIITIITFFLASSHIIEYLAQNEETYRHILSILSSPWVWLAIVACIAFVWWFLKRKASSNSLTGKVQKFISELWEGIAVVAKMPGKGRWLFWNICLWGCYFVQLFITFFAFPFTREALAENGMIVALVTFVLSSIAMGVPSNGGIGPWQWAVMFGLSLYGVSKPDGLAFGNLVLGSSTLLLIGLGIFTFICIMFQKKRNEPDGFANLKEEEEKEMIL